MKLIYSILLSLLLFSCSNEEENKITSDTDTFKNSKIISYSKNFGYSGDEITIYGENFTTDMSKITLTFDNVPATIISSTLTEIKFILPVVASVVPNLNLSIPNRSFLNEVVNDYNGNIGILPTISYNNWLVYTNLNGISLDVKKIQQMTADKMYVTIPSGTGGRLIYTNDGGISWKNIDDNWSALSAFHMTSNEGTGFNSNGVSLRKITNFTGLQVLNQIPFITTIYLDDNLNNATFITDKGKVYTATDGVNFNQVYVTSINTTDNFPPFYYPVNEKLDNNHIWAGGINKVTTNGNVNTFPFLLFKNNTTDGWKEYSFPNEFGFKSNDLAFLNETSGYFLTNKYLNTPISSKIYKTTTGGDSWSLIYDGLPFLHFTFKDANTGWAITTNKIYKTTDGGVTWQLNYTHNQDISNISYKDGVVWAFSLNNILKFHIQ